MDRATARDALYSLVAPVIVSAFDDHASETPYIRYKDVKDSLPVTVPNDVYWAWVSTQVVSEDQETLRNGTRRFRTDGLIFVQLFIPTADAQGGTRMDLIAEDIRNVFRQRAPDDTIEFTRAKIVDNIAPEPNWLRANVVSEFQYRQFL